MTYDSDEKSNALKCVLGEGVFGAGMGFVASMTALPLLLRSLGAGDLIVGLAGSIAMAGWLLLQPLGLFVLGRRRRAKRFLVPWSLGFSVPTYLAMGATVFFLAVRAPRLCALLVLVIFAVRVLGAGMTIPFWSEWQAAVFRQGIRGRVIGLMAAASGLGFSLAALTSGWVQEWLPFPGNYALLFCVPVAFYIAAMGFYVRVREPEEFSAPYQPLRAGDLFRRFGASLGDANFRRYLVGRLLLTLGGGAAAFFAVHFRSPEGGGLSDALVIKLGMLITFPQAASSYLLGRLGDRAGHKAGVVIGALAQVAAILFAFLGTGPLACAFCFSLLGIAWSAGAVAHQNMLLETCPHDSRAAHVTLSNMVLAPFVFLVPLGTGWVMELLADRRAGIGLTLIPTLVGVAWLALAVREPRHIELSRRSELPDGKEAWKRAAIP
jgi:MFS family permease